MFFNTLYRLFITLYVFMAHIAALFSPKAALWVSGRKHIWADIAERLPKTTNKHRVWIHCASLGEFEQGRPLIEALKTEYPNGIEVVLSFFSPSGYEIRKNYPLADAVFYLPADTPANAARFVGMVNPQLVIFVKYEFWFNYLNTLHQKNIPTLLVSAIFRPGQIFFKGYGAGFQKILRQYTAVFVQNRAVYELLKQHNLHQNAHIAPDTRFDRVQTTAQTAKPPIIAIEQFTQQRKLFICGSTWPKDEKLLADFIKKSPTELAFIIAPHQIDSDSLSGLLTTLKDSKTILYSDAVLLPDFATQALQYKVLILNNIGMLAQVYAYGHYAYIGGGFGAGIHNVLEAAVFGLPLFFGPRYAKFTEAVDLVHLGGAFVVKNTAGLETAFSSLFSNRANYNQASGICRQYVQQNIGGTQIIMQFLRSFHF